MSPGPPDDTCGGPGALISILMIDLSVLFSSFLLVFIAELGDKTQLAAFTLSATSRKPIAVFAGSSSALLLSTLLAVTLGKVIAGFIPGVTIYIASGLFIIFGCIMLFSKETPIIGQCFSKLLLFEETIREKLEKRVMPETFRKDMLAVIIEEEDQHIELLKYLLNNKKFFRDDINTGTEIQDICRQLSTVSPSCDHLPCYQLIDTLIEMEKLEIRFFTFLFDHLQRDEHNESRLEKELTRIIAEENSHIEELLRIKDIHDT